MRASIAGISMASSTATPSSSCNRGVIVVKTTPFSFRPSFFGSGGNSASHWFLRYISFLAVSYGIDTEPFYFHYVTIMGLLSILHLDDLRWGIDDAGIKVQVYEQKVLVVIALPVNHGIDTDPF